jgi:hypothetical protein
MNTQVISSRKGELSQCFFERDERIGTLSDFLDLLANSPTNTIVLRKADLVEAFFDLKSGIAGDFLQKVSNYGKRLIILGEFPTADGKALGDFIRESNRTGKVLFVQDLEQAIDLLR